jgi:phage gp36-like protein
MTLYATIGDLVKRFGEQEIIQLTDRDNNTGTVDKVRAARALRDAVSLIHGYLAKRYTLPLNPVPSLATRWTCDLARWFLQPHDAPEQVKANYERTLAELREAATGELDLGADELAPWSGAAEIVGPGRPFGNMKGF